MAWLRRRRPYDRSRLLAQAARARSRGRSKRALALLEEVLAHDPTDREIHRRIAPLLGGAGRADEAWSSYRVAAAGLVRAGFLDQAVGVLREAAVQLGRERAVWEQLSDLELERGRPVDAHRALLEGRQRFRRRRDRAEAIRLLLRARKLDPDHLAANFDLARLLARSGAREPAIRILEGIAQRTSGRPLRRARWRQLWLAPGPRSLWGWLRALSGRA